MAQTILTLPDYRARLDAAVTDLSLFIRELYPEAQMEVSFVRYEDEDAHIWVSLPSTFLRKSGSTWPTRSPKKAWIFCLRKAL